MPGADFVRDISPTRDRAGRSWAKSGSTGPPREGPESVTKLPLGTDNSTDPFLTEAWNLSARPGGNLRPEKSNGRSST